MNTNKQTKILLANVPYWDPLIPPQGIGCLKSFLQPHGYDVTIADLNIEPTFKELYNDYFKTFERYIPLEGRGNFFNIGHDILQNHMMAYINRENEDQYRELVKMLIDTIFYCDVTDEQVQWHEDVMIKIYAGLETYIRRKIETEKPGVLGLTVNKGNIAAALYIFKLAKEIDPGIKTLMGGGIFADTMAQGSPNLDYFLEITKEYIDKIIIGRGERFFFKYLQGELPEAQRVFTFKEVTEGEPGPHITDNPDFSGLELMHYPYLVASSSSSCPYKCSFCNSSLFYGEYREKPAQQAAAEMKQIHEKYGKRIFFMTDAMLNRTITNLTAEIEKNGIPLYFDGYFRVDLDSNDREKTLAWRRGGFYRCRLGIESGSQKILDLMDKQITPTQIKNALAGLAYAGIKTTAYFVIGHPEETEEDFRMTLDLLEESKNDIWQAECVPFAYYYNGQPESDKWAGKRELLYPDYAKKMLITQTWVLNTPPTREERYKRVFRFSQYCKQLGIPNPYSLAEVYKADERWKKLHKNAVPPLAELMNVGNKEETGKDERKEVKMLHYAVNKQQ
ncbi:MAG: radical SAM protein, partial [bacterium]|nr:radical SAM protein [bacterium]